MSIKQELSNSRLVANQSLQDLSRPIQSRDGKMWCAATKLVFGAIDFRARIGRLSTPWAAPSQLEFRPPELTFIDDNITDLLDQRAAEIVTVAQQRSKTINVLWSGGIDSTAILVSLLKSLDHSDLEMLTVWMTYASLIENFDFYRDHLHGKVTCVNAAELDITQEFLDKNILLHGDPGDCVVGPTLGAFRPYIKDGSHLLSWRDRSDLIYAYFDRNQHNVEGFGQWYVERINQNLRELDIPNIDTITDWWWWHYFNHKWEFGVWRPLLHNRRDYTKPISLKHQREYAELQYFNSHRFQLWSYSNLKNHFRGIEKDINSYKWQFKDYIFEFDRNQNYRDTKPKVTSMALDFAHNRIGGWRPPLWYDQEFRARWMWEPGVEEEIIELLEDFRS